MLSICMALRKYVPVKLFMSSQKWRRDTYNRQGNAAHTGRIRNSCTTIVVLSFTASAKRALCIGYLPLTADVFAKGVCPYRTVTMMGANAAINFELNGTIGHLNNCQRVHLISYIWTWQSTEYKTGQMINLGISPNILPAKFFCYTVCLDVQ